MLAKLHRFATKIAACDSFALALEQIIHQEIEDSKFESKKMAKVRTTFQKEKYFEKIVAIQCKA